VVYTVVCIYTFAHTFEHTKVLNNTYT